MPTLNDIIKELNDLPENRLVDVYNYVHFLKAKSNSNETARKNILSFAGAFKDMNERDLKEFENNLKKTNEELFDRNFG